MTSTNLIFSIFIFLFLLSSCGKSISYIDEGQRFVIRNGLYKKEAREMKVVYNDQKAELIQEKKQGAITQDIYLKKMKRVERGYRSKMLELRREYLKAWKKDKESKKDK